MAGMGRAVPTGAPALPRQRNLKWEHEKRQKKEEDLIDACFGNDMKKIKNTIKAG